MDVVRVLLLVALVVVVTVASALVASGRDHGPEPARITTAFEARKGSGWTSLAEEGRYLRRVDASSPRVAVSTIGRSVEGRPIQLVRVGARRTRAQIAAGSSVLFVCTQHGTEPAAREACLQTARDAADGMGATTLLIIPTANPDGLTRTERHNVDGVDINRDHLELATPEAAAIAAVIRDYRPDAVGDFHEYKTEEASEVLLADPAQLHLGVDPRIRRWSAELNRYALRSLAAVRLRTGMYPSTGGEADESVLRQQAPLRHAPSLLMETPRRGTLSPRQRVGAQRAAMRAMLRMLRDKRRELARATAAARRDAARRGASGTTRYYYASPTVFSDTPPCGYALTEEQYRSVDRRLGLHGIRAIASGGSWIVSTAQPAQPVIGLLLDPRAPREISDGQPLAC